jgi:hypothetical protein
MALKKITVTVASTVTNDTLQGYNFYSNIQGKLNVSVITPANATAGVDYNLTDGVSHDVTARPVGVTNGEFTSISSPIVLVDLSSQVGPQVTLGEVGGVSSTVVVLTANRNLQVVNQAGANGFTIDNTAEGTSITVTNVEVQLAQPNKIFLTVTSGLKPASFGLVSVDYVGTFIKDTNNLNLQSISNLGLANTIVPAIYDLLNNLNAASSPNESNSNTGFSSATTVHTEIIAAQTATAQAGARFLNVKSTNTSLGGGDQLLVTQAQANGAILAGDTYDLTFKYFIPTENVDTIQRVQKNTFAPLGGSFMNNPIFTAPATKGVWLNGSLLDLRINRKNQPLAFDFRGGASATANQSVYYDDIKMLRKTSASSLYNLFASNEAGGTGRTGAKTITWTSLNGSVLQPTVITDANGPGGVAGETYLSLSDAGGAFNNIVQAIIGSGTRMVKMKIKITGTGKFRLGNTNDGSDVLAADFATWKEVEFCSDSGLQLAMRQAANGTTIFLADIQIGAIINTTL